MTDLTGVRVAVVGATGLVGSTALEALLARPDPPAELRAFAADRGVARTLTLAGRAVEVLPAPDSPPPVDYAFFCAPDEVAGRLVPAWREAGVRVIDNSARFRLEPGVPLVVPEVNGSEVAHARGLVANPNCTTAQIAVAVAPLHRAWGLERLGIASYQAVSGAGREALEAWRAEVSGGPAGAGPFPRAIHGNVIPLIGTPGGEGYTGEERKIMRELKKILGAGSLAVSATAVRVPVGVGHGVALEATLAAAPSPEEVAECLAAAEGLRFERDPLRVPTPVEIAGRDGVFAGRLRRHPDRPDTFLLWVVADNLRKGAAINGIQILERWASGD